MIIAKSVLQKWYSSARKSNILKQRKVHASWYLTIERFLLMMVYAVICVRQKAVVHLSGLLF